MKIQINRKLIIPNNEFRWRFSRSSGPGGQNINKTESRVEIIFNITESKALNSFQKGILLDKLENKINNGCISIKIQEERTQFANRQLAISKLVTLLKEQLISKNKIRKVTKPSKASQKRRVESKKKRGRLKLNRQKTIQNDF